MIKLHRLLISFAILGLATGSNVGQATQCRDCLFDLCERVGGGFGFTSCRIEAYHCAQICVRREGYACVEWQDIEPCAYRCRPQNPCSGFQY